MTSFDIQSVIRVFIHASCLFIHTTGEYEVRFVFCKDASTTKYAIIYHFFIDLVKSDFFQFVERFVVKDKCVPHYEKGVIIFQRETVHHYSSIFVVIRVNNCGGFRPCRTILVEFDQLARVLVSICAKLRE